MGNTIAAGTNIRFEHISVEQGLSHPIVNCIFQDSKGFMWFGTEDGLNKFDGYTFTVYQPDPSDSSTLSHNDVRCIYEDASGRLWIATLGGGLNRFDRETEQFIRYTSESRRKTNIHSNYIRKFSGFFYGDRELLWIGTSAGLDKFDPVSIRMAKEQNLSLNPTKISGMCGRLMCCLAYEYDFYSKEKKRIPKIGKKVNTAQGPGKVIRQNILREILTIQLESGEEIEISPEEIIKKPIDEEKSKE